MALPLLLVNDVANTARPITKQLINAGIETKFYQPLTNAATNSRLRLAIARFLLPIILILRSRSVDLIYFHYATLAYFALFARRALVVHCHGTDLRFNLHNRYRRRTLRVLATARQIFYSTPDLESHIPEEFRYKSTFIPNPIPSSWMAQQLAFKELKPGEGATVFFISKLNQTKGVSVFIAAAEELAKLESIKRIMVFGYGNDVPAALPQSPKISYLSRVSNSEMQSLMIQSDIAVGQMELGAIGVTELECMALGLPVIANFKYEQSYGEAPPLINVNTAEGIVGGVKRLLENPGYRFDIAIKSREWVRRYHSEEVVGSLIVEKLNKVME